MSHRSKHRPLLFASLAFLAALAPVAVGAWLLHASAERRDLERFDRVTREVRDAIVRDSLRYVDYLKGVGLECAVGMTSDEWKRRRSVDEWWQRYPFLHSIGWAENAEDLAQVKARFLATPTSPEEGKELPLGQNPNWRAALERGRTTGLSVAVPAADLKPGDTNPLVMLFVPVPAKVVNGGQSGFSFGSLELHALFRQSIGGAVAGRIDWEVLAAPEHRTNTPFQREASFTLFDYTVPLRYTAGAAFWRDSHQQQSWFLLQCGVPLAAALAWVVAQQARRRAELEKRVAERTAELRLAHDRLADSLSHERELNAMKTNFISMVTHELRTPLSVVQSSADILSRYLDRLPPEKQGEHFRAIAHAVTRITDLSDEVLLFSRFEAHRMQLKVAPLDLENFCGSLTRELRSATSEKCGIVFSATPGLPQASADERLLRHVLVNLLGNAVKYSAPGKPVSLTISREGERAIFRIEDHGMGIAESEQSRLFQTFHRGSNVEHLPGTGLGLVIVKRCVELHGGTVALQSVEGQGTTVTVDLPLFPATKPSNTP